MKSDQIIAQTIENLKMIITIDTDEIRVRHRSEDIDFGYAKAYGELSGKVKEAKEYAALAIKKLSEILPDVDVDF